MINFIKKRLPKKVLKNITNTFYNIKQKNENDEEITSFGTITEITSVEGNYKFFLQIDICGSFYIFFGCDNIFIEQYKNKKKYTENEILLMGDYCKRQLEKLQPIMNSVEYIKENTEIVLLITPENYKKYSYIFKLMKKNEIIKKYVKYEMINNKQKRYEEIEVFISQKSK
jgi:hypothetical protein